MDKTIELNALLQPLYDEMNKAVANRDYNVHSQLAATINYLRMCLTNYQDGEQMESRVVVLHSK